MKYEPDHLTIPNDGTDVWEIDPKHLKYGTQVASASYGELFKGTYCSQEVAIKVLKAKLEGNFYKIQIGFSCVVIFKKYAYTNLLMELAERFDTRMPCNSWEHVVKLADFGVARVKTQSGVMTAETGTYHWMAPERNIYVTIALNGFQGLRPTIPKSTNAKFVQILQRSWQQDPTLRPDFSEIIEILQQLAKERDGKGVEFYRLHLKKKKA
ncbi:serine/threonine-protein kinase STY46-like [Trifolium pratense]|uniref:serine/threonine-protein kinase STY46-like n=1 Tax=Trifolium pratense TaxID=57577 RepID=UPI001E692F93|nr:serine/threonine-protein kinase STY46-like [Trifolium pratense]